MKNQPIITSCAGGRHNMPPPPVTLTFDLKSGVRVTCDVSYLCANFSLPRPLCSRLRADIRDRQTDVRQTTDAHHRLMPPTLGAGHTSFTQKLVRAYRLVASTTEAYHCGSVTAVCADVGAPTNVS